MSAQSNEHQTGVCPNCSFPVSTHKVSCGNCGETKFFRYLNSSEQVKKKNGLIMFLHLHLDLRSNQRVWLDRIREQRY